MIKSKEDIKLRLPKTCNHCPAMFHSMTGIQFCELGYRVNYLPIDDPRVKEWKKYTPYEDLTIRIIPKEPCPRPKNISEKLEIRAVIDVHRYSRVGSPEYEEDMKDSRLMTEEESREHYIKHSNLNR